MRHRKGQNHCQTTQRLPKVTTVVQACSKQATESVGIMYEPCLLAKRCLQCWPASGIVATNSRRVKVLAGVILIVGRVEH